MRSAASEPERATRPDDRRRWLWAAIGAGTLLILALLVGGLVSWHFSSKVLVPDHAAWPEDVTVEAVRPGEIVLERTEETTRPGYMGLIWQGGHAIAGPVLAKEDETVTRRLDKVDGYLVPDLEVGIESNVYVGNPRQARGLPFAGIDIEGELGPMPAWWIPARGEATPAAAQTTRGRTWAIFVHGINNSPQNGLRLAPLMRRSGMLSLLISYRDDLGAPESPDGYHHMGLTEWRDLEAAARYALSHGARRLVLVGYSMGGAIVARFIERSPLADRVSALILDAPVLNWKRVLEFNSTEMGLPSAFGLPVEWAIGARIDADWASLDALDQTEDFHLPILLFHGTEDDVVPIETSDKFAEELPQWVTYYSIPNAGHTQGWNVDPPLYEARVRRFLEKALQKGQKRSEPDRSRARAAE